MAGIIYCAKCKTHMVGVSTRKQGRKFPYYLCNKRWRIRECDQDYVRADLLEAAIIKDIRTTLRDEDFMARLWAKANELLVAEKPAMKKELARIEGQIAKAKAKLDRYFEAFEAGTMKPDLCNQKVKDLTATLDALEIERRELAARQTRLTIPPVDQEMLKEILSEFDETMANGTNPQKKHLLRRMVKKVLIHDRRTIEVWYCLPKRTSVRTADYLAPWAGLEPAT